MRKEYITPRITSLVTSNSILQAISDLPPLKIHFTPDNDADPDEDVL